MDECITGLVNRWMDGWMTMWIDGQMDGGIDERLAVGWMRELLDDGK